MQPAGSWHIRYPKGYDRINFFAIGDIHYGSKNCLVKQLDKDVSRVVADPGSFWFGMGDYCEFITPQDKRWEPGCVDEDMKVKDLENLGWWQMEQVSRHLMPIRDKCLGLLYGNHESKYMSHNDSGVIHQQLCDLMRTRNLMYSSVLDVHLYETGVKIPTLSDVAPEKFKAHRKLRFGLHHGFGGACTPAGKMNSLIKWMNVIEADCYFMGHTHDQVARAEVRLAADDDCKEIKHKRRLGLVSGSYLLTYAPGSPSYGEQKGYAPVSLGAVRATVELETGRLLAEI